MYDLTRICQTFFKSYSFTKDRSQFIGSRQGDARPPRCMVGCINERIIHGNCFLFCFVLFCLLIYSRFCPVGCIQSPLKMREYSLKK